MTNLQELEKTLKVNTKGQISDTFSVYKGVQSLGHSIKNMFGGGSKNTGTIRSEKNQITTQMEQEEKSRSELRGVGKS